MSVEYALETLIRAGRHWKNEIDILVQVIDDPEVVERYREERDRVSKALSVLDPNKQYPMLPELEVSLIE